MKNRISNGVFEGSDIEPGVFHEPVMVDPRDQAQGQEGGESPADADNPDAQPPTDDTDS